MYLTMSLARGYNSDPGMDHRQRSKLSLVVKGYIDASFDTDPDDYKDNASLEILFL